MQINIIFISDYNWGKLHTFLDENVKAITVENNIEVGISEDEEVNILDVSLVSTIYKIKSLILHI